MLIFWYIDITIYIYIYTYYVVHHMYIIYIYMDLYIYTDMGITCFTAPTQSFQVIYMRTFQRCCAGFRDVVHVSEVLYTFHKPHNKYIYILHIIYYIIYIYIYYYISLYYILYIIYCESEVVSPNMYWCLFLKESSSTAWQVNNGFRMALLFSGTAVGLEPKGRFDVPPWQWILECRIICEYTIVRSLHSIRTPHA